MHHFLPLLFIPAAMALKVANLQHRCLRDRCSLWSHPFAAVD
jgi:hypothetical protein